MVSVTTCCKRITCTCIHYAEFIICTIYKYLHDTRVCKSRTSLRVKSIFCHVWCIIRMYIILAGKLAFGRFSFSSAPTTAVRRWRCSDSHSVMAHRRRLSNISDIMCVLGGINTMHAVICKNKLCTLKLVKGSIQLRGLLLCALFVYGM